MNVWPMILRLRSGSVTPASLSMNRSAASTNSSGSFSFSANRCRICVGLVEAQHAVVHEHAREPVADGAMDDHRRDGRVHAAAERADDAPLAHLRANPRRRLVDERGHRPVARAAADAEREVAQDLEPAIGVRDLRDGTAGRRGGEPDPAWRPPARWRWSRRRRTRRARPRRSRRGWPTRAARRAATRTARRLATSRGPSRGRTRDARPARRGRRASRSSAASRSRCPARATRP